MAGEGEWLVEEDVDLLGTWLASMRATQLNTLDFALKHFQITWSLNRPSSLENHREGIIFSSFFE